MSAVLTVEDLRVRFGTKRGVAEVVSGIGYTLHEAETVSYTHLTLPTNREV